MDKPNPGSAEIDGDEAEDKSEGGGDLEVDETLDAHAPDALQVAVAGDAGDQRCEDERSDDGLDQAKKDVAENTQVDGDCGASKPSSAPAIIATKIHTVRDRRRTASIASNPIAAQRRMVATM